MLTLVKRIPTSIRTLRGRLEELVPVKAEERKKLVKEYGQHVLGEHTVAQAYGGMRGIKGMVWEPSVLDSVEGIRYRGLTLFECQEQLPSAANGSEPLPESTLWLLLTGEVPTQEQVAGLSADLASRASVPQDALSLINSLPKTMHPMTQLTMGVMALQPSSKFAAAYTEGVNKADLWEYALEDSLDVIAKLPAVAAQIYNNVYRAGDIAEYDASLDWGANYAKMMGFNDETVFDLMRLYLTIHADHEGGNVSAHTTHLVGSALSDPYLSLAAGLNGLAGPLHGLANQEVLRWLGKLADELGPAPSKDELRQFISNTIANGQVVPGYGHAVLRKTDPRYTVQRNFALKHLPNDPLFKLVSDLYEVVPDVLGSIGKIQNPWPNVDAHSGVLLKHFGINEESYYTVLFGVSRAIGVLSNLVWARAYGLPIERPKSLSTEAIKKAVGL